MLANTVVKDWSANDLVLTKKEVYSTSIWQDGALSEAIMSVTIVNV